MLTAHQIGTAPGLLTRILDRVAQWREALDLALELKGLNSDDARLLLERRGAIYGLSWGLPAMARIAVRLLLRLMNSLGLDPAAVARANPEVMRDLQRGCASCGVRSRCEREQEIGQAHATYQVFCPNAATLDKLRHEGVGAA